MTFGLKDLFALIACAAIGCGSIAWYTRLPPNDFFARLAGLVPLVFALLISVICPIAIVVAAMFRRRAIQRRRKFSELD